MHSPGESGPALAVAARICGIIAGVLRLVHVRTCDPLPVSARFYPETPAAAAAVLEQALLMAWACGGPRATTVVVDVIQGGLTRPLMTPVSVHASQAHHPRS